VVLFKIKNTLIAFRNCKLALQIKMHRVKTEKETSNGYNLREIWYYSRIERQKDVSKSVIWEIPVLKSAQKFFNN